MSKKKKVSAFEYAISEAAVDKEFMKTHEPYTKEEEIQQRIDKITSIGKRLKIKTK